MRLSGQHRIRPASRVRAGRDSLGWAQVGKGERASPGAGRRRTACIRPAPTRHCVYQHMGGRQGARRTDRRRHRIDHRPWPHHRVAEPRLRSGPGWGAGRRICNWPAARRPVGRASPLAAQCEQGRRRPSCVPLRPHRLAASRLAVHVSCTMATRRRGRPRAGIAWPHGALHRRVSLARSPPADRVSHDFEHTAWPLRGWRSGRAARLRLAGAVGPGRALRGHAAHFTAAWA